MGRTPYLLAVKALIHNNDQLNDYLSRENLNVLNYRRTLRSTRARNAKDIIEVAFGI